MANPTLGIITFGSDGKLVRTDGAYNGNQGMFEQIGGVLDEAIKSNAGAMNELMKKMDGSDPDSNPSDPVILARWQQVSNQYAQALQLQGATVKLFSEVDSQLLRYLAQ